MTTITIAPSDELGALATRFPAASRIFHRYRFDFCCGGAKTLEEACRDAGLQANDVIEEIHQACLEPSSEPRNWAQRPLAELTEFIVRHYHEPLRPELDRLEAMGERVLEVHGDKDPERLARLAQAIGQLAAELRDHMRKEEMILFPCIAAGDGQGAGGPISVMEHEHAGAGRLLQEIESLTDGHTPPAGACTTWRALYLGLAELDRVLKDHIHLENNILFPRALAE